MDDENWKVKIGNGVKSHGRSGWGEVCPGGEEGTETNYDKVKRWAQLSLRFSLVDGIGVKREDRICSQCGLREVEDVEHFVLRCGGLV